MTEVEALIVQHGPDGMNQVVEVVQRLAHAHHDDVGDRPVFTEVARDLQDLVGDLGR